MAQSMQDEDPVPSSTVLDIFTLVTGGLIGALLLGMAIDGLRRMVLLAGSDQVTVVDAPTGDLT